jgi:hypothetical protein
MPRSPRLVPGRIHVRFHLKTLIAIVTGVAIGLGVRQSWLRLEARRAYCRSRVVFHSAEESRWRSLAGIDEARARALQSEAALWRADAQNPLSGVNVKLVTRRAEAYEREADRVLDVLVRDDLRLAEDHARLRRLYEAASKARPWSPDPPLDSP